MQDFKDAFCAYMSIFIDGTILEDIHFYKDRTLRGRKWEVCLYYTDTWLILSLCSCCLTFSHFRLFLALNRSVMVVGTRQPTTYHL